MTPKFRAWLKTQKKMVDVHVMVFVEGTVCHIRHDIEGGSFRKGSSNNFNLMQSTGLKDINGKEIYEGDVILCEWGEMGDNIYIKTKKMVVNFSPHNLVMLEEADRLQILGNIYENPELIKEDEK